VRRRVASLAFGITDMTIVEATAKDLLDADPSVRGDAVLVRRALEAGVVVVYARPFIGSRGLMQLAPAPFRTPRLRQTHETFLDVRHRVYSHTDDTDFRFLLELDEHDWFDRFLESGIEGFAESWWPPPPPVLEDVQALAAANRESYHAELERLRVRLRSE
jgi:hypothetical protein